MEFVCVKARSSDLMAGVRWLVASDKIIPLKEKLNVSQRDLTDLAPHSASFVRKKGSKHKLSTLDLSVQEFLEENVDIAS